MKKMQKLKVLDLFSGIGGFTLGFERAGGFETVAFCEIEEYPRKILAKHWPDIPCFKDIRKLTRSDIDGKINVICGGYPCQPFSQAGKRKGAEDNRHLWPEISRILDEFRPDWFVGENVVGHISMGIDEVLSDLESKDYTSRTFVVPACAVDAPHRRDRIWILANRADQNSKDVANADKTRLQRRPNPANTQKIRKRRDQHTQRCFDNSGWNAWPAEPELDRMAYGIPNRVDRIKALGNAVIPQIPEILGKAILSANQEMEIEK